MGLLEQLKHKGDELTNEQKSAFVLLTFLGLGGVVLGFLSFGANIRRPFDIQLAKSANEAPYLTLDQKEAKERELQKTRDSDTDGLSDYDELYVFRTSPYISDTDSDGIDDKTEAFAGTNPNCPEGKTCGGAVVASDTANTSVTPLDLSNPLLGSVGSAASGSLDIKSPEDIQKYVQSITVAQIRSALEAAGTPKDKLDAITDEQIKALFEKTVTDANASGQLQQLVNKTATDSGAAADTQSANP